MTEIGLTFEVEVARLQAERYWSQQPGAIQGLIKAQLLLLDCAANECEHHFAYDHSFRIGSSGQLFWTQVDQIAMSVGNELAVGINDPKMLVKFECLNRGTRWRR